MVPAVHEDEARAVLDGDEAISEIEGECCPNCDSPQVVRLYSWASLPLSLALVAGVTIHASP